MSTALLHVSSHDPYPYPYIYISSTYIVYSIIQSDHINTYKRRFCGFVLLLSASILLFTYIYTDTDTDRVTTRGAMQ
jgi:hypothetical protein